MTPTWRTLDTEIKYGEASRTNMQMGKGMFAERALLGIRQRALTAADVRSMYGLKRASRNRYAGSSHVRSGRVTGNDKGETDTINVRTRDIEATE
ncbi:hypothetical protein R1flu_007038 [Riccia fluitans]|uniref:Uncharacterized protein n=1 Tax=Riccia fluitans TaxID=41844 RepID=A0ABD1Z0E8_9MARC